MKAHVRTKDFKIWGGAEPLLADQRADALAQAGMLSSRGEHEIIDPAVNRPEPRAFTASYLGADSR